MRRPLISILAPAYRHERFIRTCVESLQAQTYADWELLVLDDGSDDRTAEIVRGVRDKRVQWFTRPHQGPTGLADLYAEGLRRTRGELVAVAECDDFFPPNKLADLIEPLADPAVDAAFGITQCVDAAGGWLDRTIPSRQFLEAVPRAALCNDPPGTLTAAMMRHDVLCVSTQSLLVRRSALEAIGGFQRTADGRIVDLPTAYVLGLRASFRFVPKVCAFYRLHDTNSTRNLPGWIQISAGQREFIRGLLAEEADAIPLTARERRAVLARWTSSHLGARVAYGRTLLVDRRWDEARRQFRIVLRSGRPRLAVPAALGYAGSWCRRDIEALYQLTGRRSVQREVARA